MQFPQLRLQWSTLLSGMPRKITVNHPVTGKAETFVLTREALLRLIRAPLYMPALAAAVPTAIHAASQGDFGGIIGLAGGMGNRKSQRLAMGMHFSVVCAEDVPRLANAGSPPGVDFGRVDAQLYEAVCQFWPRGAVADAFYNVPPAQSPVLVLSGGADPATPPRHGARVSKALGNKAQHIVVPQAGHGVMGIGCMRDVLYRFIAAADDASALPQDATCATKLPRPGVFLPVQAGADTGAKA
jgi:pimeloyl-ACP methyl ester carboxylesterase